MKRLLPAILLAIALLCACNSTNRQAQAYVDQLQSGQQVSAQDYSDMVEFYCTSLSGIMADLEPLHRAQADAINSGDSIAAERNADKLRRKTDDVSRRNAAVTALGNELFRHLEHLPDTTRLRLITYLADLSRRYSNY